MHMWHLTPFPHFMGLSWTYPCEGLYSDWQLLLPILSHPTEPSLDSLSSSSSQAKSDEKRAIHLSKWANWLHFTHWPFPSLRQSIHAKYIPNCLSALVLPSNVSKHVSLCLCGFCFFHQKSELNSIFCLIGVRALSETMYLLTYYKKANRQNDANYY